MERPLRKIMASTPEIELEINKVRDAIWALYTEVMEASRTQKNKEQVKVHYSKLVEMVVVSPGVRTVLDAFKANREEMLKTLDHPGLPLQNNQGERDIRMVKLKQKIAGTFRAFHGGEIFCRIRSYISTARKQGWSIWDSLADAIRGSPRLLDENQHVVLQTVAV